MGSVSSKIFRWSFQSSAPQGARQRLLASLQGATITIPNLQTLFHDWPQGVNPELDRLNEDVERKLEALFPNGRRLRKMKAAKAALFGASWWPYADFETLRIATYLSIWLFAWDDETDSCEFSTLCSDLEKATKFRAETLGSIRNVLEPTDDTKPHLLASNDIIAMFEEIGTAICKTSSAGQIDSFLNELVFFVNMTDVEQRCQMSEILPSLEEYQKRRMGSSAVGVCIAITEYCYGIDIPQHIMRGRTMRLLWDETNIIISTSNDILSIKKEIAQDQVDTLIPLLTNLHGSPQAAIDAAFEILASSVKSFEKVALSLLAQHSDDQVLLQKLQNFIDGCRYACTGNLKWSLSSGRYDLGEESTKEAFQVTL